MKSRPGGPPVAVYREIGDGGTQVTWRWLCRVPGCCANEWRGRWSDAFTDAHEHLRRHQAFGFRSGKS